MNWAKTVCAGRNLVYQDWEDGENSISNLIIDHLEKLDVNFVTIEDISAMMEFLDTPNGKFENGYKKWENYLSRIDYKERINKFKD